MRTTLCGLYTLRFDRKLLLYTLVWYYTLIWHHRVIVQMRTLFQDGIFHSSTYAIRSTGALKKELDGCKVMPIGDLHILNSFLNIQEQF